MNDSTQLPNSSSVQVQVNVPEIATKQLKFRQVGQRRILTISTNFLNIFGFNKGDSVVEKVIASGKGLVIERVRELEFESRTKKVYGRSYPRRKNNPFETLLEVSSQKLIADAFPDGVSQVHVLFEKDRVTVTPITSVAERAQANAMKVLVAPLFWSSDRRRSATRPI